MGTVPTVYRWDDSNAPLYPSSDSAYLDSDLVGRILKACLVDGYGSKAAAGWSELHYQAPTSSEDGRLILTNAHQTGVADITLDSNGECRIRRLAAGWDGENLVDQLPYENTVDGGPARVVDDPRSQRWCVVANENACVVLLWRDVEGLSGNYLSGYNGLAFFLGEVLPVSPEITMGSVPNFAAFTVRGNYVGGGRPIGGGQEGGLLSRVAADGTENTSSSEEVSQLRAYGFEDINAPSDFDTDALAIPLLPVYLRDTTIGLNFARLPGLALALSVPGEARLVADRDERSVWTGSFSSINGQNVILVCSRKFYGWVSLAAEDWP